MLLPGLQDAAFHPPPHLITCLTEASRPGGRWARLWEVGQEVEVLEGKTQLCSSMPGQGRLLAAPKGIAGPVRGSRVGGSGGLGVSG